MTAPLQHMEQARSIRNAAKDNFDVRRAQVKLDLEARGVGGRIADQISNEARGAFNEAMEIADENRSIVAGTIAALAIWWIRNRK